jgi:uncharacterized protein YqjF (DUF2071 family)
VHHALKQIEHRPWPLPPGPWILQQTWNDLLFAHWPMPWEQLRPLVPPQLAIDTCEGRAWIAVAPFHMSGIRARFMPAIPGASALPELNVRTYVTYGGKPGVFFFSLDAASPLAVWAARAAYHLPYFYARMHVQDNDGWIQYTCSRASSEAEFLARYRPLNPPQLHEPRSLEHWLTERYCLYTVSGAAVYRAEIHHPQWPLQDAEAEFQTNTMAAAAGIEFPLSPPLLHFAKSLDVLIWPLQKC